MTRKKYLQECANSYLAKTYESLDSCDIEFINCIIDAFEAGAKWADANPNSGVVDLSQVWHNVKEEPEKGRLMICIDKHNVSINEWIDQYNCDWLDFAECFGIIIWAYIEDLLPKGGNEKDIK